MSIDLQSRGAAFKRQLMAEAREMMVGLLNTVNATVAAQDDGVGVSNQHRVLNFLGPGVAVSDDSGNRRVNVYIPGTPAGTSTTAVVSAAGSEQVFDNGTSGTGPSGWMNPGFSPGAGWTTSVVNSNSGMPTAPSGASYVTKSNASQPTDERFLYLRTFVVAAGTPTSVTLEFAIDDYCEAAWLNGNSLAVNATQQGGSQAISVPSNYLIAGTTNVLAMQERNSSVGVPTTGWMRLAYRLSYSIGASLGLPYANVQDQKAQNTSGGTFTNGADRTRTLNTVVDDSIGITVATNQVTLPSGTYRFRVVVPAYQVQRHQAWLYDVTHATVLRRGTSGYAETTGGHDYSHIVGKMVLSGSTALEVRHRCATSVTTRGFGVEANFGAEVYTIAEFWKET